MICADKTIQRQLLSATRNAMVFRTILEELQQRGHSCDQRRCQEKIKALEKKYKEAVDRLRRSSVGIKSDDDLDDHEIYVGFRWFADIHTVMRTRAAVIRLADAIFFSHSSSPQLLTYSLKKA